jgi:hypothetical protein
MMKLKLKQQSPSSVRMTGPHKGAASCSSFSWRSLSIVTTTLGLLLLVQLPTLVTSRAILGIDLGSLYMKVALVQSGAPLEIVTNLHSKRKTEQMVLFDRGQRFYGADANALLARKSTNTPVSMSVVLGKDEWHPTVKVCVPPPQQGDSVCVCVCVY